MERKGFVLAALVTVGLILFVAAPYVQAEGYRLDGAWLRSTFDAATGEPQHNAIIVLTPKNPSARAAAARGSFLNPDPDLIPPGGYVTDFIGELVMTGPSTYEATAYAYVMVPNPGGRDLVSLIIIGIASGTFSNENLITGTQSGSIYLGVQDTNGDLIPDYDIEGFPLPIPEATFIDKRTPMVP